MGFKFFQSYYCGIDSVNDYYDVRVTASLKSVKGKGKASSLDIAPLTILNSGTLQPQKWQLTGNDFSTAAHAVAAQSPR